MAINLSILYRGELSGCNYGCLYCPFAKRVDQPEHLKKDEAQVRRFVAWTNERADDRLGVFFTPWGEALVRPWYQHAIAELSNLPQIDRVAIQTNLSCKLSWLDQCDPNTVGLWCTYHPDEVERDRFLDQCKRLDAAGIRYSVGIVGLREHFDEIEAMRSQLNPNTYLWVNAYKREANYYTPDDLDRLASIDPLFELNNRYHASRGQACAAGESVISVDGEGTIRRCHFIKEPLGNLYDPNWRDALSPRPCTNDTCGCHIGYAHLKTLELDRLFGQGLLDRSLSTRPQRSDALARLARTEQKPYQLTSDGLPI